MKREFSAGGVVYKNQGEKVLWLLRRPTPNPEYKGNLGWSFPKGWIDDAPEGGQPGPLASGKVKATEQDLQQAALRETREEGGVIAAIEKKLSTLKLFFTDSKGEKVMKFVTYYLMKYVSDAPEGHDNETEEVYWATTDEAKKLLVHKNEKEMLSNV